jgi:hypothetical protein
MEAVSLFIDAELEFISIFSPANILLATEPEE